MTGTPLSWILAFLAGLGIGGWYFGGLWLTVHCFTRVRYPALLLLGSFVIRALTSVWGFYVIMQGSGVRLIASLLGFLVVRTIMIGRSPYELTKPRKREGSPGPQHSSM